MTQVFTITTIEEWEAVIKYAGDRIHLCNAEGVDLTQIASGHEYSMIWIAGDLQHKIINSDIFIEPNTDVGRKIIKDICQLEKLQSI